MANLNGHAYGLTMLSPIKAGADHVDAVESYLEAMPNGVQSPWARVSTTHLARWVVLKALPDQRPTFAEDTLRSAYLLHESNFDASEPASDGVSLVEYLRCWIRAMPRELDAIYGHCVGFPGASSVPEVVAYFRKCQIRTTFFFADYADKPRGSAENVLRALAVQRQFIRLVGDAQGKSPQHKKALFETFMASLPDLRGLPGAS
jgi:hypothetical protein